MEFFHRHNESKITIFLEIENILILKSYRIMLKNVYSYIIIILETTNTKFT